MIPRLAHYSPVFFQLPDRSRAAAYEDVNTKPVEIRLVVEHSAEPLLWCIAWPVGAGDGGRRVVRLAMESEHRRALGVKAVTLDARELVVTGPDKGREHDGEKGGEEPRPVRVKEYPLGKVFLWQRQQLTRIAEEVFVECMDKYPGFDSQKRWAIGVLTKAVEESIFDRERMFWCAHEAYKDCSNPRSPVSRIAWSDLV